MSQPPEADAGQPLSRERLEELVTELSHSVARLQHRLRKTEESLDKLLTAHLDPTEKRPYLDYLVKLGGLEPTTAVLDVGCGPGRIARELRPFLQAAGRYTGLEIQRRLVEQLRDEYADLPNFTFHHADLRNTEYNARGSVSPSDYTFPLPEASVDLVVLRSVFTHMLPAGIERYLSEIGRVLRPGGRSVISFYLLNDQSHPFVAAQPRPIFGEYPFDGRGSFPHDCGDYRVRYREIPERAVAYDEGFVRGLYSRHGLQIAEPIHYGSWSGRTRFLTGQDIVVACKEPSPVG